MRRSTLTLEESRHVDDHSGREIITYTPVFRPDVTARGELRFALFQVWADEPRTYEGARKRALVNARVCLENFARVELEDHELIGIPDDHWRDADHERGGE